MQQKDCYICELAAGNDQDLESKMSDIVFEDQHTLAFISRDQSEATPGKTLVVPKLHYSINTQPDAVIIAIADTCRLITEAQKRAFQSAFSVKVENVGYELQTSDHALTHVVPSFSPEWPSLVKEDFSIRPISTRRQFANELKAVLSAVCTSDGTINSARTILAALLQTPVRNY